jgi:hypothetical protein
MRTVIATITGVSPYSQSAYHNTPKNGQEGHNDYEERTWRERMHKDANGNVFVPPMGLKHALVSVSKFLAQRIPGKGQKTYTKRFEAGVLCFEPMGLGVKVDDVPGEWLFVPSDGVAGSGKRVNKCFGRIDEWEGKVEFKVIDELITGA